MLSKRAMQLISIYRNWDESIYRNRRLEMEFLIADGTIEREYGESCIEEWDTVASINNWTQETRQ